ncbi:hypothetical protein IGI86_002668 [Enterococcus sp. AZ188]|uniref:VirB4-like conjugal transfer ATPase, CD1110 family n=1 Tax=Enterococcus sp. AZ188 TaxID=2774678 RepID=UPI003D2FFFEE
MKKSKKNELKRDKTKIVDSFPIKSFLENDLVETHEGLFSISLVVNDIDYQLSSEEKKMDVYMDYCNFLNSIDHNTTIQLTIQKKKRSMEDFKNTIFYEYKEDGYNLYRKELNNLMIDKVSEDRNGYCKSIIFTFSQKYEDVNQALKELESLADRFKMFCRRVGTTATILKADDRKRIIGNVLIKNDNQDISEISDEFYLPKCIDFKSNARCIDADGLMCQSLYFKEYPSELSDTFLSDLMEIPGEFTFSLFLKSMNPPDAFDLVRTKLAFMEQQKVDEQKKALKSGYDFEMLPYDLSHSLVEAKELLDDLQNKGQKIFEITGNLIYSSTDKDQLERIKDEIKSVARRYGFKLSVIPYLQEQSLYNSFPIGKNSIPLHRTLTTASAAIFMPFSTPELIHKNGKYYGVNSVTKNILSLDRKQLKAPNGFVLGTPGSGKSFSVKREIVNILVQEDLDEIIIIDPEREYVSLGEKFSGEIVKISSESKTHINPMDINENYGDDIDPTILKSEFIISFCDLIVGGSVGLSSAQKTIIDRVCRRTYEINHLQKRKDYSPTLLDFFKVLKEQPEEEAAQLVTDLELYIEGSLSVFSKPTNVDLTNRLVVYDIKDLGRQLKTIGMLVVLDQVWNRITKNRSSGIRTWIYIDEMQLLFSNDYSSNYFFELWSRARKWGAIPTGITQNVETLLLSDMARRMLSNSDFVMMLNQAKTDRNQLVRLFDISEEQEKFMNLTEEGRGLLVFGDSTVPFYDHFPKETSLYKMMTTKPGEVIENIEQRRISDNNEFE